MIFTPAGTPVWDGTVRLRDTRTGEEADVTTAVWAPNTFDPAYDGWASMWVTGNYSCDCNRTEFFAMAMDRDTMHEPTCGEERYTIVAPAWLAELETEERA